MSNHQLVITDLFIYPIKSLGGIRLDASMVGIMGLLHDRRWVLIDETNRFITQREIPQLAFLATEITEDQLKVYDKRDSGDYLLLELFPKTGETISVQIWDDVCEAILVSEVANSWFSRKLGMPAKLAYMPSSTKRLVDTSYAKEGEVTGFSDGYSILLVGAASLVDLNARLEIPVGIDRFRPNIVFSGGSPYEEDQMNEIKINDLLLLGVKPCARCIMTTTNQETAERSKEPLYTLSTYRKQNNKVNFGQNVLVKGEGSIQVGDVITYK